MTKRWDRFTLFLRQPGAPLDNNLCERALKKAILHRKNSLFYKTQNGARVGDIFMSFIYTCQLCGADPFDYLTQFHRNASALADCASDWMPWNYPDSMKVAASAPETDRPELPSQKSSSLTGRTRVVGAGPCCEKIIVLDRNRTGASGSSARAAVRKVLIWQFVHSSCERPANLRVPGTITPAEGTIGPYPLFKPCFSMHDIR